MLALALLAVFVAPPPAEAQSAPGNLRITSVSPSNVAIAWDAVSGADGGYQIQARQPDQAGSDGQGPVNQFATIRHFGSNITSRTLTGSDDRVATGVRMEIRVRACTTSTDCGGTFTTALAVTPGTPPAAPSDSSFIVFAAGDRMVQALWGPIGNNDQGSGTFERYRLQYKESTASDWSGATDTTVTGRMTSITTVTVPSVSASYDFRIRAESTVWHSAWTVVRAVAGKPGSPTGFSASQVAGSVAIDVTWTAPTDNGGKPITGYSVQWREHVVGNWSDHGEAGTKNVGADATSVQITQADGLAPSTNYNFRISARNVDRRSFWTPNNESVAAMTSVDPAGPPGKPTNPRATAQSSAIIRFQWDPPAAGTGGTHDWYQYDAKLASETDWGSHSGQARSSTSTFTWNRGNLHPGTTYDFRARACKVSTCDTAPGPWSDTASATTDAIQPNPPGNFRVTDVTNDNQDVLAWDVPSDDGGSAITGYKLERREIGQTAWETAVDKGPTQRTHNYNKASWSVGYDYRVRAVNAVGESANSNVVQVGGRPTFKSGAAGTPTATPATNSVAVTLDWADKLAANGGKDVSEWRYRYQVSGQNAWTTVSNVDPGTTSVTVGAPDLQPGTAYDFDVIACNEDRCSFTSTDATATTASIGASISSPASLTEGELDGARLTVDLVGVQFLQNLEAASNPFTVVNPRGLSVSSVERVSNTQAVLTLGFTGDISDDLSLSLIVERNLAITGTQDLLVSLPVTAETAPAMVVILTARGGAGTVTVTWLEILSAHGYKVQWKSGSEEFDASRQLVITGGGTTSAVIPGLAPSTRYDIRVIATKNLAPDGMPSGERSATTDAISAILDNTNPSPLTESGLNGATVTVDLFGTEYVSSLGPSDFGLLPQTVGGLSVTSVNRQSDTRAVLTLGFTGNIVANVSLQVVVDGSANAAGSPLTSDTVTVIQAATPAKVSSVGAEPGPASLTITWNAVDHADGYRVSVRRSGDTSDVTIRDIAGGSATRAGISGLLGDTQYDVRVRALSDFATEGAWSIPITATTQPGHAIVSSTDPSPLTEGNLDGAVLTVDLLPGIYDPWAPRLDRAEVTVSGVPGVTTTLADVTRVSDERMLVRLAYDGTDFDTDRVLRVEFYGAHTSIGTITAVADVAAVVEPPPGRVQNVQVTPGPLSVSVTWDPVDDATGYRLEWNPPAAFGSSYHKTWPWPPRYTIGALLPDTQYTVRVVATKTRAPDGPASAAATATTPAVGVNLVRTEPSPLTEDNLHGARLTVDLEGIEWSRLVEGRYYRFQLGWLNDCSEAKYYDNCYPFIVTRSVVVTGVERVSDSRIVVSLWARNVDLQGNGLWLRFFDDLHTHYYGEPEYMVVELIERDQPDFEIAQNNRASVTVTAADPVSVAEGGAAASYTVALDGQPAGNVVIATSSDNGDVTTQPASLTFTRDNWQTPQTVSIRAGHDDDAVDDAATVSHTVSGAQGYDGIDVASVSVAVSDDDTAGVTVHPTSLSVDEGGSANYTVVLDAQPVSNVVIYVSDGNGVTVQPSSLTFTPDNWQTTQTVTVSGAQDNDTDDETAYVTHSILADAGSAYVGVLASYVEVSVADDDEAQAEAAQQEPEPEPEPGSVTVSANSLGVREGDDGATYAVVLDVEPTANVVVTVSSDNGDVAAEPGSLTFTPGNWQSAQTVTVSAGEDEDKNDELAIVSHGASGGNYDGVSVGFVTVIVTDDDTTVEVLRDFYHATDGANWTNSGNWLSSRPLAEWHGVTVNEDGEVTGLALRDNNLVGTLAPELGKLERLEVLSLDRNSISGELPAELGDLSNLTRLALNRNSLTGAIPSELGSLSNLSIIGLARNQLSGALPASLGNLSELTRLSLHDNTGLSGALPSGFTNLVDLERLAIANTGLCAPDDEGFTEWLDGVADKPGGVATCE